MVREQTTRDRICEAAIHVAGRDGLLAMTLDNVAKEAGISKGGLTHHFPSKEELIQGMLVYFGIQTEQMLMRRIVDDPDPKFRWGRALLSCVFPTEDEKDQNELSPEVVKRMLLTTIALAINNPNALDPLRELGRKMRDRFMSDPEDGMEQLLMWLALDGLFLWEFVGLIDRSDPLYDQIGEALRARIKMKKDRKSRGEDDNG